MPLQSKKTVKVHEISAGTTKQQYLAFVEHLCTKPQTTSKSHFSRLTKHFKRKSKLLVRASASAPTDEVDEDAKLKNETELTPPPSTLKVQGEQAAPLLNNSPPTAKGWKETTLCLQNGLPVGTISLESESLKNEALARRAKDKKSCWKEWVVDDNFKGVTILYEGPNAKFDICAVHGLGGNAIDTWTTDRGKMWLRDLLPEHPNFENSRIMTFGYDSDLTDRSTVMELENWAETLLRSLNEVRTGDKVATITRGVLDKHIADQAMAQLHPPSNCQNIALSQCGIVFLATPHSGSAKADWSNFLVATAHTIGGVRPETVRILQAFNTASVWDTAAYFDLNPCPPFRCFAEGLKMRVKGTNQHIVTQASATLGTRQAYMIMDVDHSSICKFESKLGPFTTISMELWNLFNQVTTGGVQQMNAQPERRGFGQPRFLAHAYPPDRGFWWEGTELNGVQHQLTSTKPFFGRSAELDTLESSLAGDGTHPSLTVIKGIAGMGKTELLLQFAAMQRDRRNVFFSGSQDGETIDSVLSKLSIRIGFDMIEDPGENQDRWRSTPVAERIQIFITWLGDTCNKDSLFIIDDIEAFGYSNIPVILKYPARHTLISTRDSNLKRADRVFRELRLPSLGHDDTVRILKSILESLSADSASWDSLGSIARTVQDHPLAARNAIPFAMDHLVPNESPSSAFSQVFESQDPEEREVFLKYCFEGQSLWKAFDTSLERLTLQRNTESAASLLQLLPFLSCGNDCVDDFFKMDKRSLLLGREKELPDMAILKSSYTKIRSWLFQLRSVSFFIQSGSSNNTKTLNIHPLMLQYMLLRLHERRRVDLIRQVLQLCHALVDSQKELEAQIKPHVLHCIQVCRGLGILLHSLGLPESTMRWVEGLQETEVDREEDPFSDPIDLSSTAVDEFISLIITTSCSRFYPYATGALSLYRASRDMDLNKDNLLRFYRFIRSFQCERIPCDLLIRACQPKSTWSSSGEAVERLPLEAGVPEWLIDFYDTNKPIFHDLDHGAHISGMEITVEHGIPYFEVATASQPEPELCQLSSIVDERSMAQERIVVFLQAFPSINTEIIGEEIVDRLMDIATRSILPLLSCVTDGDIKEWLLPKNHENLDSYIFSLLEFLYQAIAILGAEHPVLPLSLPEQVLKIVPQGTGNVTIGHLQKLTNILKRFKDIGQDALECNPLSPGMKVDKRSHAILGYFLSLNDGHLAEALSTWQPLFYNIPSTMEYLAATSFCSQPHLTLIGRPAFRVLDARVIEGLLRSRRKQHEQAAKILEASRSEVVSEYGSSSMQLGIVTAELANCYNILRQEALAESRLRSTLQDRLNSNSSTRCDGIYLCLALADSLIGQARYEEAVPVLKGVIDKPDIPATFRMMSALRLAKSQRRMLCDPVESFEQDSPLWIGLALLGNVPEVLVMEFVEELGCNLSQIPKGHLSEPSTTQLIEEVNSVLRRSRSIADSPCLEWYTNLQQEYFEGIAKTTKTNKGKEKDTGSQTKDKNEIGSPISSQTSPCLRTPADVNMSDDEGPWSERLVLTFDGGGVTALSSLLILKGIMERIKNHEIEHDDGPAFSSSSNPGLELGPLPVTASLAADVDEFLPWHYFDYVAGTSTGGLNAIMLGRLQMSVDQAIYHFIEFCNSVFGHPKAFHNVSTRFLPNPKYSSARAGDAFERIIMSSHMVSDKDRQTKEVFARSEPFISQDNHIRTMAISLRTRYGDTMPHIWRSFVPVDAEPYESRDAASICEVALATSANPLHFDAMEISGAVYTTGDLVAINPSYMVLEEVFFQHNKPPSVFVSIGTGSDGHNIKTSIGKLRMSSVARRPYREEAKRDLSPDLPTYSDGGGTSQWLSLAEQMGLEQVYRLDIEDDLHEMPNDDWRPAKTGRFTIKDITNVTEIHLKSQAMKDKIDNIAKEAVRIRRARARTKRWEAFAMDPYYICPFCRNQETYDLSKDLRLHLWDHHFDRLLYDSEIQTALYQGRRFKGEKFN
ncbi:hypothetical protein FAGAP_5165 [Fusarium agapanthi]|uniref:PNPLA domain-containing protein n=1 Tax=Fusarium agapanthi TaxID=1803897 RepID=A0A9P5B9Y0_9HYPO|nr:hypothetical protein FAGAP_5165 [Fusarium agapanthi]